MIRLRIQGSADVRASLVGVLKNYDKHVEIVTDLCDDEDRPDMTVVECYRSLPPRASIVKDWIQAMEGSSDGLRSVTCYYLWGLRDETEYGWWCATGDTSESHTYVTTETVPDDRSWYIDLPEITPLYSFAKQYHLL